jgi:hypothetical protein
VIHAGANCSCLHNPHDTRPLSIAEFDRYITAKIELVLGIALIMLMPPLPLCGEVDLKTYPGDPKTYTLRTMEHTNEFAGVIRQIAARYTGKGVFLCDIHRGMVQAASQSNEGMAALFEPNDSKCESSFMCSISHLIPLQKCIPMKQDMVSSLTTVPRRWMGWCIRFHGSKLWVSLFC